MSAPALDERIHHQVLAAGVAAQLGGWQVYDYGTVPGLDDNPGDVPPMYVLLQIERRHTPADHAARRHTRSAWRATTRAVGTTPGEVRALTKAVGVALDGRRYVIDSHLSTPLQHESSTAPEPDGDAVSALTNWTYHL